MNRESGETHGQAELSETACLSQISIAFCLSDRNTYLFKSKIFLNMKSKARPRRRLFAGPCRIADISGGVELCIKDQYAAGYVEK